jgi:hypothetical protein
MPGQFAPSPKNLMLRRGGSRVSRTGREESGPLSDPRQIAVRAMYKTPPRTSSAPSPIRNILASQFIAATHNRTGIQADARRFVPAGKGTASGSCPRDERRQSLGSSADAIPERGGLRRAEVAMTAREIADALVADKAPRATRKQAIDLQAAILAALRKRDGLTVIGEVRPSGGNWLPC